MSNDPKDDDDLRQVERGFLATHTHASQNFGNLFHVAATVAALADIMIAKGLLTAEELERHIGPASERLAKSDFGRGLEFMMLNSKVDKHTVASAPVNCAERLPHCRSACCSLDVPLSPADVEAGKLRWDLGRPYQLRRRADGFCGHLDRAGGGCSVYDDRPLVCRTYSCAKDKRIWIDFEKMVPNVKSIDALLARRNLLTLMAADSGPVDGHAGVAQVTAVDAPPDEPYDPSRER